MSLVVGSSMSSLRDAVCSRTVLPVLLVAAVGGCLPELSRQLEPVRVGAVAPDFVLPAARGGSQSLTADRGSVVLLSFLDADAANVDEQFEASRQQLVFLKSMHDQYADAGLRVVVVHAGAPIPARALINYSYDNGLRFPLLTGTAKPSVATAFGATSLPTTVVIDREGRLARRWRGYVPPARLADAVEASLDR